jgi:Fe-S-cluster formation regulator IscX/YfhJ
VPLKIIALTGPKGSGKDTVGRMITEMYPHLNPKTIAFADPIKTKIYHLFDLNADNNEQYDLFKRTKLTYQLDGHLSHSVEARHVVREIGMIMRGYDTKQFTNYVVDKIKADPNKLWVVTDLRFDEEYIMLKNLGAKVVKILRPSYNYDGHITERGFDDHLVDTMLMNDGDLDYLKIRIEYVMKGILEGTI